MVQSYVSGTPEHGKYVSEFCDKLLDTFQKKTSGSIGGLLLIYCGGSRIPLGGGTNLFGGCQLPTFVCQNERIGSLGRACIRCNAPSWICQCVRKSCDKRLDTVHQIVVFNWTYWVFWIAMLDGGCDLLCLKHINLALVHA